MVAMKPEHLTGASRLVFGNCLELKELRELVRPARLELATSWFVARRSIQLSYGRAVIADTRVPPLLPREIGAGAEERS